MGLFKPFEYDIHPTSSEQPESDADDIDVTDSANDADSGAATDSDGEQIESTRDVNAANLADDEGRSKPDDQE